jgi:hypothetical protein
VPAAQAPTPAVRTKVRAPAHVPRSGLAPGPAELASVATPAGAGVRSARRLARARVHQREVSAQASAPSPAGARVPSARPVARTRVHDRAVLALAPPPAHAWLASARRPARARVHQWEVSAQPSAPSPGRARMASARRAARARVHPWEVSVLASAPSRERARMASARPVVRARSRAGAAPRARAAPRPGRTRAGAARRAPRRRARPCPMRAARRPGSGQRHPLPLRRHGRLPLKVELPRADHARLARWRKERRNRKPVSATREGCSRCHRGCFRFLTRSASSPVVRREANSRTGHRAEATKHGSDSPLHPGKPGPEPITPARGLEATTVPDNSAPCRSVARPITSATWSDAAARQQAWEPRVSDSE